MEQASAPPAWPAQPACEGYSGSSSGTASASPSRMQADMLDDMMDLADLGDMPCDLELPDCFSGLNGIPDTVTDTFDPDTAMHGADVMFSSSLSFNKPNRNRDNSLTLSECADSLFKELDILGTSPNSSNNGCNAAFFDTPMASEAGSSDNSDREEEEEEVEVVDNKTILRKNHNKASYNERPRPSTSILESAQLDHCYYSTQPPLEVEATHVGSAGTPLTPTASSDDECERQGRPRSLLGKRKHMAEAASMDDGELKFKFRMKFGSSYSPDRRRGKGDHNKGEDETAASQQRHGPKRRSAMKNTHCPSPAKEQHQPAAHPPSSPPKLQVAKPTASSSSSSLKALKALRRPEKRLERPTGEQKCRELRDLHNSMERQRRVDLKINFDQLKDKVPELRDTDKASKMVILNKAAEYSRLLCKTDLVLDKERDRVARRNAELRQRLELAKR